MPMLKIIASDLDGTLLNRLHVTDSYILNTIDKALDKGLIFVLVTGRSMQSDTIGLKFGERPLYVISNNGALIKDTNQTILKTKSLPHTFIVDTLNKFPNLPMDFMSTNQTWVNADKKSYLKTFSVGKHLIHRMLLRIVNGFFKGKKFNATPEEILNQEIIKMNLRIPNPQTNALFLEHLKNHPEVVNLPFAEGIFEITHHKVNKATALKWLCDYLKIDYDAVAVFGDGNNDIELLDEFKHSYAVSNAIPEAKEKATHVIGHYAKYSVSKKIRELIE